MTANGWFQIFFYLLAVFLVTKPLGVFMARVFSREKTFLDAILRPIEKFIYRLSGVDENQEMKWTEYTVAMLLLSGVSMTLLYLIERTQKWLPLNPQKFGNVDPALAFGTAASFTTNTNWQVYSGESTMSYLTQMAGLAYHNFVSAAVGIVLAIVVIRGIARRETDRLGNFWVDTTRCLLWGRMTGCQRHGWAIWAGMAFLFLAGVSTAYWAEARGNPLLAGTDQHVSALQTGGNSEGKEVRFGIANSALFATVTTDASCGAINGQHDSFTPLGGLVPLVNIMLGEVVFGGVGAGLYGMFVFVVLAVFIAGLMVGRTPEYLGKKIESYDVKMAMLAVLILTFTILVFAAVSVVKPYGTAGISNPGPHGLSQILYAYVSSTGNNGSAFAGLNGNTLWYNTTTAAAQLLGRFFMIIPIMAIAGNLARKKMVPESAGTFPVTGGLFSGLLVSTILIVGTLTFFPALSLGPILEHLLMHAGKVF